MTANFSQTTISKSAKRVYTNPIATLESFNMVVAAFMADSHKRPSKNNNIPN